ncbi:STAS-like domain-containing protein [Nitrosomonas ureae]|uniref:STAS-like domain-containing protein n=1 Tax=Nitrosomonas ureae TaxID=44577 RepID=UPI001C66A49D
MNCRIAPSSCFEKFSTVVLDFDGIEEIDQAFADEVFRVFQNAHKNAHAQQQDSSIQFVWNRFYVSLIPMIHC